MKKSLLPLAIALAFNAAAANATAPATAAAKHVVLISVDGLHQNDLDWYVKNNPTSTLATLVAQGVEYNNAMTQFPSDSFPGMVGQVTGGNPHSTGIYYDVSYNRNLLAPGTTSCAGATPGTVVAFDESIDKNSSRIDAGQNIPNLYTNAPSNFSLISWLSSNPLTLINPANLPVDPSTCMPVYPHQYLQVNTIFEVAHSHGMRTAWSDKHPAYEILGGPSGKGISEYFTPEINSLISLTSSNDFTKDNLSTQLYDNLKVTAVVNWAQGQNHSGTAVVGTPAIYGMNFQSVSTAQKLNTSSYTDPATGSVMQNGLGGYVKDASTGAMMPGPVLTGALNFVDQSIGKIVKAVDANTVVIVSAKHGQSPVNRADLTLINDGDMNAALDAAWNAAHPGANGLIANSMDDDGVLLWLKDTSAEATTFAKNFLFNYSGTGVGSDSNGNPTSKPFTNTGLAAVYAGADAAQFLNVPANDPRAPDVVGVAKTGSVFAGGHLSKIAEHGGNNVNDRHVPILVWGAGIASGKVVKAPVATPQIAPTILKVLGLNVNTLQAVKMEKTAVLPGLN